MRKNSGQARLQRLERSDCGQVALIALLIMIVLLTVGLAVVSRSVTDIRISKESEESARAFSAAEAGIEEALKGLAGLPYTDNVYTGSTEVGGLSVDYKVEKTSSFQTNIEQNETAEVQLDGFAGTGLNVSWSNSGLELILIYDDSGVYKAMRWALYNFSDGSVCGNNFTDVPSGLESIDVSTISPKALRIRPICRDAEVTVASSDPGLNPLPDQSYTIRSSAVVPETGQTRSLEVTKSVPILPPLFDYVLFSGGSLIKP